MIRILTNKEIDAVNGGVNAFLMPLAVITLPVSDVVENNDATESNSSTDSEN